VSIVCVYVKVFNDIDSDNNYHPEGQLELAEARLDSVGLKVLCSY